MGALHVKWRAVTCEFTEEMTLKLNAEDYVGFIWWAWWEERYSRLRNIRRKGTKKRISLENINRYGQSAEAFEEGRTGKIWVLPEESGLEWNGNDWGAAEVTSTVHIWGRDDRYRATSFLGKGWDRPHRTGSLQQIDPRDGHSFPEFTRTKQHSCRICSLLWYPEG